MIIINIIMVTFYHFPDQTFLLLKFLFTIFAARKRCGDTKSTFTDYKKKVMKIWYIFFDFPWTSGKWSVFLIFTGPYRTYSAGINLLKVNKRNNGTTRCEMCSKFTIKTPIGVVLVSFLLTLNKFHTFF